MALADMRQATLALLAYVREGKKPEGPNPLPRGLKPWEADLRTQERGGSGNKGWLAWLWEYAWNNTRKARTYLLTRLKWELKNGLMAHEQTTVTYGGLHLGCVVLLWYLAWHRGDEEIQRLAGAWIERVLLLECLTGRREGDRIRLMSPGMRADVRSVTHGRQVESAIVGTLLGIPQGLRLDHDDWWGPLWDAVRACEGVGMAAARVSLTCRRLLADKGVFSETAMDLWLKPLRQVRLMVPMRWHSWPDGSWWAWLHKSTGASQDPGKMGGGEINGQHVFLWPWEDGSDPPEGGWRAEAEFAIDTEGRDLIADWWRHGGWRAERSITLPPGRPPILIGAPSGSDPLGDLPPEMDPRKHPWRQGGRGEPEEEEPKMVPRWSVKTWIKPHLQATYRSVPEIVWQAQRLRDGEPQARERLEGAVDRLRKEAQDG